MQVNNQNKFEERPVNFIRIEDFSDFSENGYPIESLVLIVKNGNDDFILIMELCVLVSEQKQVNLLIVQKWLKRLIILKWLKLLEII